MDPATAPGFENFEEEYYEPLASDTEQGIDVVESVSAQADDEIFDVVISDAPAKEAPARVHVSGGSGFIEPTEPPPNPSTNTCALMFAEIERKGLDGHQVSSMNTLYAVGIQQIIKDVFRIENTIKNTRTATPEDREIEEISFNVKFTDVILEPPALPTIEGGLQTLTPTAAHIQSKSYVTNIKVGITTTMTARYTSGKIATRTDTLENINLGAIAACVGSQMCATNGMSREAIKSIGGDPSSIGGYFILRGGKWNAEANENLTNNTFHVYKNKYNNEVARGLFLSKPGDAFENSFQTILKLLNDGSIVVELTLNKEDRISIPFYIMFRAFGMTRDQDIVDHIVHGVGNTDPTTVKLETLLSKAFMAKDSRFEAIDTESDSMKIISFIAHMFKEVADEAAARKNKDVSKYRVSSILATIDKIFFPHIGTTEADRFNKVKFLAHLVRELLSVYAGILPSTDRDSYQNKRVYPSGIAFSKVFKTIFNLSIVQTIQRDFAKAIRNTKFNDIAIGTIIRSAISHANLEQAMTRAMAPSKKGGKQEVTAKIGTSQVYLKNALNLIASICTVTTPNPPAGKSNERARVMRQPHPTHLGYICVTASADTGDKVGTVKQMGISMSISGSSSSYALKHELAQDKDVLSNVAPRDISAKKLAIVLVNGAPIGYVASSHEFVRRWRHKRRSGEIDRRVTIVWYLSVRKICFWTDYGRVHRPLLIVYNNGAAYEEAARAGNPIEFKQWTQYTTDHEFGLRNGTITMEDLENEGVIEYISAEEQINTMIARSIQHFNELTNDITELFTHVDDPRAIFGVTALAAPLPGNSNAVRITMQTNHRKQAAGWFALNYHEIAEKNTTLSHYIEKPIVSTFTDALTTPTGSNAYVAIALHGGFNVEDSIQINRSSTDRGLFAVTQFNVEQSEAEHNEHFQMTDRAVTTDIKREANYANIDGVAARVGSMVSKNDVLIVKVSKIPKSTGVHMWSDQSTLHGKAERMRVADVIRARNNNDNDMIKVKLQAFRPLGDGDKLSSRTGNKGIVSIAVPACDMPYTEDGIPVDLIINAHSIPTRMALNQINESALGIFAANRGSFVDATAFTEIDMKKIIRELDQMGLKYSGHQRMYSGLTGEPIDTLLYVGVTHYMRLEKFVIDEQYAMTNGPTSALTGQPLNGKSLGGGLRIGEMEKDTLCAQGAMRALRDKLWVDSDGEKNIICVTCGRFAVFNVQESLYSCRNCGPREQFGEIETTKSANLFHYRTSAIGVTPRYQVDTNSFL